MSVSTRESNVFDSILQSVVREYSATTYVMLTQQGRAIIRRQVPSYQVSATIVSIDGANPIYNQCTYHTDVVAVQQRLVEFRLLPPLHCCLAAGHPVSTRTDHRELRLTIR